MLSVISHCRLLKDKSNFTFEFRDALEFKNVPDKVKCYYLIANKQHTINPVVDESDQVPQYGFVLNSSTPPSTPRPFSPSTTARPPFSPSMMVPNPAEPSKCPFSSRVTAPGINITEATPTPTTSKRSSLTGSEVSFGSRSPTPDEGLEDPGLQMKIEEHHSPFLEVMRRISGLEPVTEADEDVIGESGEPGKNETIPTARKISNDSNASAESAEGKTTLRKVSDASNESGIQSSGSKTSDGGGGERKLSASSCDGMVEVQDDLHLIRRSGSVSDKIKKFDTLSRDRQRKTGLHCVAQEPTETTLKNQNDNKLRPERKSLDSIGSTGSNDCIES